MSDAVDREEQRVAVNRSAAWDDGYQTGRAVAEANLAGWMERAIVAEAQVRQIHALTGHLDPATRASLRQQVQVTQ